MTRSKFKAISGNIWKTNTKNDFNRIQNGWNTNENVIIESFTMLIERTTDSKLVYRLQ